MLTVCPKGNCEWHKAQIPLLLCSAADVYCLHVLQQTADDLSLIILPDATQTCKQRNLFSVIAKITKKQISIVLWFVSQRTCVSFAAIDNIPHA